MKNITPRWLSLLSIAAMAVLLVACSGSSSSGGEGNRNGTRIDVLAKDFSFSLEPSQTEAGRIRIVVQNDGSVQHDFTLRGNGVEQKTAIIDPGKREILEVDLGPGTYTFICTVPGHELLGMQGTLTVVPSS